VTPTRQSSRPKRARRDTDFVTDEDVDHEGGEAWDGGGAGDDGADGGDGDEYGGDSDDDDGTGRARRRASRKSRGTAIAGLSPGTDGATPTPAAVRGGRRQSRNSNGQCPAKSDIAVACL